MPVRFRCPACQFPVFNRRIARCEKCNAEIPSAMLFSDHDIERINQESNENEKKRREIAEELERDRENGAFGRRSAG